LISDRRCQQREGSGRHNAITMKRNENHEGPSAAKPQPK